jgi:hypothetical protein
MTASLPLHTCPEPEGLFSLLTGNTRPVVVTMPAKTLFEELEDVLTNRLKNALRTGEIINAPDWASDVAQCLAAVVTMPEIEEIPHLRQFAHDELDRFIKERLEERRQGQAPAVE